MEHYVLVKYSDNWADEMDIEGFIVTTLDQWIERTKDFIEWFDAIGEYIFSIGTNEQIEYYGYSDFINHFTISPILTEDEASVLISHFKINKVFGFFPESDEIELKYLKEEKLQEQDDD